MTREVDSGPGGTDPGAAFVRELLAAHGALDETRLAGALARGPRRRGAPLRGPRVVPFALVTVSALLVLATAEAARRRFWVTKAPPAASAVVPQSPSRTTPGAPMATLSAAPAAQRPLGRSTPDVLHREAPRQRDAPPPDSPAVAPVARAAEARAVHSSPTTPSARPASASGERAAGGGSAVEATPGAGPAIVPAVAQAGSRASRSVATAPPARRAAAPGPVAAKLAGAASDALFRRGFVALRVTGRPADALPLLLDYAARYPDGGLAEDALGLALEAALRTDDAGRGALARQYLARFAAGRYRRLALRALAPVRPAAP